MKQSGNALSLNVHSLCSNTPNSGNAANNTRERKLYFIKCVLQMFTAVSLKMLKDWLSEI